jgi:ATP synthase protein I
VSAIDLPRARRLAFGVVVSQAAVSVLASLCAFGLGGRVAAISALVGGGIATAGSLAMAGVVFGGSGASAPPRALNRFYLGEALKLAVVVVLFVVALKAMRVVPLAMFAAFAAALLVYWIALLKAPPATGGTPRDA